MLKITIKAEDESTLARILHNLQQQQATPVNPVNVVDTGVPVEHFDTDALLAEVRRRLHKDGYAVNVVPDGSANAVPDEPATKPPQSEPKVIKRRGRKPRTAAPAAAPNGAPAVVPSSPSPLPPPPPPPPPPPSRSEVIDALEKYAGQNGMITARKIIAEISGIENAALKDVRPADYRRLMEALAC